MKLSTVHGIVLIMASLCVTILGLEIALRIYHGIISESPNHEPPNKGRMEYHSRLGWTPRPGRHGVNWISNVNESGVRSNGRILTVGNKSILAVGDSFTFGDEVEDSETWPAQLEGILEQRVLNAGVGAYGIDQAVLRAEILLDELHPDIVILSFISDDINRTEFKYYPWGRGQKPYFKLENDSLVLRNVPVPKTVDKVPGSPPYLRCALGYSFLANAVFRRIVPRWWHGYPNMEVIQVHEYGEDVSVKLLIHLDDLTRSLGGQFVVIAFATNGQIGDNGRLSNVIKKTRMNGIQVLDLATETLKLPPDKLPNLFLNEGHYSPKMNTLIAGQIARFLRERGIIESF